MTELDVFGSQLIETRARALDLTFALGKSCPEVQTFNKLYTLEAIKNQLELQILDLNPSWRSFELGAIIENTSCALNFFLCIIFSRQNWVLCCDFLAFKWPIENFDLLWPSTDIKSQISKKSNLLVNQGGQKWM